MKRAAPTDLLSTDLLKTGSLLAPLLSSLGAALAPPGRSLMPKQGHLRRSQTDPAPSGERALPVTAAFLLKCRFNGDCLEIVMPEFAHVLHEIEEGQWQAAKLGNSMARFT